MRKRKYTNIVVYDDFNCSSSYDYVVRVSWKENGEWAETREFWVNQNAFIARGHNYMTWESAPRYLVNEVNQALWQAVTRGDYQVFEYDRDGAQRYENLRYHNANYFKRLVGRHVGIEVPYEPEAD